MELGKEERFFNLIPLANSPAEENFKGHVGDTQPDVTDFYLKINPTEFNGLIAKRKLKGC